jgi:hypothetical protein
MKPLIKFTAREENVLDLLMTFPVAPDTWKGVNSSGPYEQGTSNSNRWIASELGIAERTVKQYVTRIGKKYGVRRGGRFLLRNRIVYMEAIRRGLVVPVLSNSTKPSA